MGRHTFAAVLFCVVIAVAWAAVAVRADVVLTEDGAPRADIVISPQPLRTVRLAAQELQNYVEKISGVHLPIVTTPGPAANHVFVGRSPHTDQRSVTADGLHCGAYRIVARDNWLALLGEDSEFTPIEPWARNNAEIVSGKVQRAWDGITGALWGVPNRLIYKDRFTLPGDTGLPDAQREPGVRLPPVELWRFDERGSFNAVCGLLRRLGVRWYAPGDIGEVLPTLPTIRLPPLDQTVRPDFPVRNVNVRLGVLPREVGLWALRLGMREPYGLELAHGMHAMTHRPEILARHPNWFALYGGRRNNQPDQQLNQLCYSNEELFQETVRNVRAQFDHYKVDVVSVMPPDGYTSICQCPRCAGQDTPERGQRGLLSDYIWGFANRVAREVGKTHPDRKISNSAYGAYTLPPLKIDKLEPNVQVCVVGGRRPVQNRPEEQEECRKLREAWRAKTDNPLLIFENYPFTDRGWYLPSFTPHALGASINATKGISLGEDIWLSVRQDFQKTGMGFNHFLIYFTQRMYWGGPDADVDALFREYCHLFYGPAEQEIRTFFEFCEANWQTMEKDKAQADAALALFARAQARAEAGSIYGRRLALLDDYLKGLRNKSAQLGRKRGPVPTLRLVGEVRGPIVIDGRLDDDAWTHCPVASTGRLRELQTGRPPIFGTTFKAAWIGSNLYFAIRCDEHPGEKPNNAATKKDDAALWYGDCIEVLLETESHSYYQIAVSPAGVVVDLDRSASRNAWFSWDSQAEVATAIADDHWTVEMRIPVTPDENDPLHLVIGRKPTRSLPWHFNVCRQRIRDGATEASAFSPTGGETFHDAMKLARLYDGQHAEFEAERESDYLATIRAAADLARGGKRAEALAAYTAAAEGPATDFQRSYALEQAAAVARGLRKPDVADALAQRIPLVPVQKTVRMQNLLEGGAAARLVAEFAAEDIAAWPFWQRGDGLLARGSAYAAVKSAQKAEADLAAALPWISDARLRDQALLKLGQNRAANLNDDAGALDAYRRIVDGAKSLGSATQFYALHGIAGIHSRRGQHAEALAALGRVDPAKLQGLWRDQFRLWNAEALQAAGRHDEARAACKALAADPSADPRLRKEAEKRLGAAP